MSARIPVRPSLELTEQLRVEGVVRDALGARPGESILDACRRVLAKKPGPGRPMTKVRVAMAITNSPAPGWPELRRAAALVST